MSNDIEIKIKNLVDMYVEMEGRVGRAEVAAEIAEERSKLSHDMMLKMLVGLYRFRWYKPWTWFVKIDVSDHLKTPPETPSKGGV